MFLKVRIAQFDVEGNTFVGIIGTEIVDDKYANPGQTVTLEKSSTYNFQVPGTYAVIAEIIAFEVDLQGNLICGKLLDAESHIL